MRLSRAPLAAIVTAALSTVLLAAVTLPVAAATASAATTAAAAATVSGNARAVVPWDRVGAGWVLTEYTTARPDGGSGPATLLLISPAGARYRPASWPSWRTAPQLVAWSPDGKRALFQVFSGPGGAELLTLATGQVSRFVLPGSASPIGFTTPDGPAIVASQPAGRETSLTRYRLSGRLARSLGSSADGQVLYAPSGTEFATGAASGLELVTNSGTPIRALRVPGTTARSCNPVRWWNGSTIRAAPARSCGWSR